MMPGEQATAGVSPPGRPSEPQEDARHAVARLLAALMPALKYRGDPGAVEAGFEEAARRLLPAGEVRLREGDAGRPESGREPVRQADGLLTIAVPNTEGGVPARLEIRLLPGCASDAWDGQLIDMLSHVAALVLEIRRSRQWRCAGGLDLLPRRDGAAPLIGSSAVMQALRDRIERVAVTDFTVLIEGESGVGKELVAQQIHELSRRRHGPFVAVNCAALVETLLEAELFGIEDRTATGVRGRRGKFEHADGGTLFLDEVSDLSVSAQAKLLRAIQDLAVERVGGQGCRRVDVRIVAATNRSLTELAQRGLFRHDLFYRLSGVDLRVPPLRLRREDIPGLAAYFLERHRATRVLALSPAATDALVAYHWPGNVRELQRLIERAVALTETDRIELDDLPPVLRGDYAEILLPSLARGEAMRAWGSRYARLTLERCGHNKRQACRILGISYHTLQAYLRYGTPSENAPAPPEWPDQQEDPAREERLGSHDGEDDEDRPSSEGA